MKRKKILYFFVIAILFFSGGCATMTMTEKERLIASGYYSELEKLTQDEIKDISTAKSAELVNLCIAYSKTKKYGKLFSCLEQLEHNIEKGDKTAFGMWSSTVLYPSDVTAFPHLLKAEVYIELGNYERATESARKAYELVQSIDWPFVDRAGNWHIRYKIRSLSLLTMAYAFKGDRKNASQHLKELGDISVGIWGAVPLKKDKSLWLAKAYMAAGEYDKLLANRGGIDALGGFLEVFLGGTIFAHVDLPREFMITKALYETGNIKDAKDGYDRLLSNSETKSNGEIYWPILFDRGRISQAEGSIKQAIEFYEKSIDVIETQRSTINTEASKIGFVGDKQKVYHQMIAALYSDNQYINAFEYVERSKSRALVDLLASNKEFSVPKDKEQVASMLKELETIESEGKAIDISSIAPEKANQRHIRSVQIKERIKNLTPELTSLVTVSIPPPTEIQSNISADETLVEYYYHGEDLYVFVLNRNTLKAVKLDGKGILKDIEQFRRLLQDPKSTQYPELSQGLYQRLIKPIENLIATPKLIIVPHGILHYLPFNALNSGSNYLIDKYSVSFLPSASVIKFLKQRQAQKNRQTLIFGNPDLGDPKYDLKYAGEEAVAISNELPDSRVLLRKEATETNFKRSANQFGYIHFATHGMFESDSPLNSGLFLSRDAENDGLLSVNELYSISLNADLVTLSACETALGKINAGDDVVGLQRGFLYAGANSIVASLWKVDDLATSQLMTGFYSNLKKTNKRDALRAAQLTVKKRYEHPYFWAAFQLTGMTE
ncbi:MAG: CHAT domain-containing protein [Nitrospirae bacterium]|nr:CHAT domain-containing protein [Nitrospirota bacterium]